MIIGTVLVLWCAWVLEYGAMRKFERKGWHFLGVVNTTFLLQDILNYVG